MKIKALVLAVVALGVTACAGNQQCVQPNPFEPIANCGVDYDTPCTWQAD